MDERSETIEGTLGEEGVDEETCSVDWGGKSETNRRRYFGDRRNRGPP